MTIGVTQLDSSPPPGPYPVSSVIPKGTSVPKALEGGPITADTDQKAPASIYIFDGNDETKGKSTDPNTANTQMGRLTKIRDLLAGTLSASITNATALGQALMSASSPVAMASDQSPIPFNFKQVNGAALSPSNPTITEQSIQNWIRNGQGFVSSSGQQTSAGAVLAEFSIFNPAASGKNMLLYSLRVFTSIATNNRVMFLTVDPALTAATITNNKIGAATPVSTSTWSVLTQALAGTPYVEAQSSGATLIEFIVPGAPLLFPSGTAGGLAVFLNLTGVASMSCTAQVIEF